MKKKTLGLTLVASAMLAGFVFLPSAEAQISPQVDAQLRQAAQAAADTAAYYGRTQNLPPGLYEQNIKKAYDDAYRAHANALGIQVNIPYTPSLVEQQSSYYGYNAPRYRTRGRILNYLF